VSAVARAQEVHERSVAREIVLAGAAAGLLGGAAMMLFLCLSFLGHHMELREPVVAVAALFMGPRALVAGPGAVLAGVAIHAVVSAAIGIAFAAIVPRFVGAGPALAYGLAASGVVMLVMTFAVLPWADPTLVARAAFFPVTWIFVHALFGVGLAFVPAFRRHL